MPRRSYHTLSSLLLSLQGFEVVIELKNDVELKGILEEVDAGMNITLLDVVQVVGGDSNLRSTFDIMFVAGRTIRYVHIPDAINVIENLKRHVNIY